MRLPTLALLALGCAATVTAQVGEISLNVGNSRLRNESLGDLSDGVAADAKNNLHMSVKMTLNSWRFFGHEFGYNYNRGKIESQGAELGGMPIHQGFYNFVGYATPEGRRIRPFAAGGLHFSSFYPPGASVFNGNGITKFGYNYGGGVKVRVSEMFLIRFDVHDYATAKPDLGLSNQKGWLHQLVVSSGLAFVF